MLTTSNPRLWFTLSGLLVAFVVLGGSCLGIASMVGDVESNYLRSANTASRWKLTNLPEQSFLWRSDAPTDEQWAALPTALQKRKESWRTTLNDVLKMRPPERLKEVESALKAADSSLADLFVKAEKAIGEKDKDASRWGLTIIRRRLRAMEREIEGILQRIYQPDTLKETPDGTDPARRAERGFGQPASPTGAANQGQM